MKLFISIICSFLLSISLQAETYLSSILYYGSYEFDQTIAYDNILILRSSSIFIYENGNLLNYFDESLLRTVDKSSRFYSFKYDKLNRRLVFCSDSGMVTYNIDNEEVKFVKTGFRVYFFDVYNSTAMISSGNDFVWWDLDKGLIKREKKGITGEIMFRMIDSERFILYHAQAAYLYSAGHYDKLFDGVEQLLHRYEEIQIYNDYLLYKPFRQNTVVFNMITKSQEAELDNKYQSWNLLSFKDDKVYYGNNDARLCSYNLNSKITNINSSVFARYLWGCDGIIFYDFLNKILRFNDDTKVSKQVVRNITENIADNLELLQDYIVIHQREPLLEVLNKQGEAILDGMIVLANNNSYALGDANTIYYQNLENQLIIVDLDQHKTNVIQELDFEVDQLYYQDGTLYYLYNDKLYKYKDNNQFEVFKNITDCYKVELIENSSIYYFSNANNEGDDMYLNMLDLNSNVIVCDSVPVSKYASYRKSFLKMQDTIYLREYNKLRYINPNTLETVRKI